LAARAVLVSLTLAAKSRAEDLPDSIEVDVRDCAPPQFGGAERSIALELQLSGIRSVERRVTDAPAARLTVVLSCTPSVEATAILYDLVTANEVARHFPLADTPEPERARALALALTEFVRGEWLGLSARSEAADGPAGVAVRVHPVPAIADKNGSAAAPVPAPTAAPRAPAPAAPAASATLPVNSPPAPKADQARLAVMARARFFAQYSTLAFGGSAGLELGRFTPRVEALFARSSTALGRAAFGGAAAAIGFEAFRARHGQFAVAAGPAVSAGVTWATGSSDRANVRVQNQIAPYADLRAELSGALRVGAIDLSTLLEVGAAAGISEFAGTQLAGGYGGWFGGVGVGVSY